MLIGICCFVDMGKKKITLTLKDQLKKALLLHGSSKIAEAALPLLKEKDSSVPSQPTIPQPISQVPPVRQSGKPDSPEESSHPENKRQQLGKWLSSCLYGLFLGQGC